MSIYIYIPFYGDMSYIYILVQTNIQKTQHNNVFSYISSIIKIKLNIFFAFTQHQFKSFINPDCI